MKNILEFLAVFSFVIILAGCTSKTEEKVVKCTLNQNNAAQNYEIESVYSIYTDGSVVNKVETTEIVTSDDDYVLDYFENYTNTLYTNMNNAYGGYDFNITKEAIDFIIEIGYDINFGARPLKRFLSKNLETLLAKKLIDGSVISGDNLTVDVKDDDLIIAK